MPPRKKIETQEIDAELLANLDRVPIVDQLRKYGGFTPHPDDRVRSTGAKGMSYVTKLLKDNHLNSCLETRANNALVPGIAIDAVDGNDEAAEFVRMAIKKMDRPFMQIARATMVHAAGYGYEIAQRLWKQIEDGPYKGAWIISGLKPIPAELVKFDHNEAGTVKQDGVVIYPTPLNFGNGNEQRFDRNLFLHAIWGYTYNPYGESEALKCDFWVWAKEIMAKFRMVHGEKHGSPSVAFSLSRQIKRGSTEWNDLVKLIDDFQNNSGFILPTGIKAELLQAVRSGDLDYDNAYDRGNKEISKQILGSTATSEGASRGQAGGYAQAKVMGNTTDNYAWIDALWLESILQQQFIEPLFYMNYSYDTPCPQIRILDDDYARQVATANIIMSLTQAGAEIPEEWAFNQLKIPPAKPGQRVLKSATSELRPSSDTQNNGLDNKLFHTPTQSSGGEISSISRFSALYQSQRDTTLQGIEADSFRVISHEIRQMFEQALEAVLSLPEGTALANPPTLELDPQRLNTALARGLWQHYLTGKFFGTKEIADQIGETVPGTDDQAPKLVEKFRAFVGAAGVPPVPSKGKKSKQFASDPSLPDSLLSAQASLAQIGQTIPITAAEVQAVAAFYQQLGVSISGLIETDVQTIYRKLALGQKNGWSVREFQASIQEAGIKYAGEIFGGSVAQGSPLTMGHVETIYRNHMMRAFAEGKDALANDPEIGDLVWGFQIVTTQDDRVRDDHAALEGVTLPKDHPKWSYLKPPLYHNCRCDRKIITSMEFNRGQVKVTPDSQLPAYDASKFF